MNRAKYHIIGNNGGEFFFSMASGKAWCRSLEFYKGVTRQARLKRLVLLCAYPFLRSNCTIETMADQIERGTGFRPVLSSECSGIISPTGDKAVIHDPGRGYWKAATGQSYEGVKREADIYRLLAKTQPKSFGFSRIEGFQDNGASVSFWMIEEPGAFCKDCVIPLKALVKPLAEFYQLSPNGLIHGDFKPWNVRLRRDGRPHFFDFEAVHEGELLEDLLNYVTQPLLLKYSPEKVKTILNEHPPKEVKEYLELLKERAGF